MNVFLGLTFIAAVITNAYATPLLREGDEENSQLFLAKLSNLIKARKREMVRSAPHFSSSSSLPFNPFYPRGKTDQQKATDMLLKVRKFLEMGRRAKEDSTFVSTKLQEKALQQFFSRIMDTRAGKGHHSNHKKCDTKKREIAAAGEQDYIKFQSLNRTNAEKLITDLFSCTTKRLPDYLQSLKGTKIFGLPASTILKIFSGLTGKSDVKFYQGLINSLLSFFGGSKMPAKEQVSDDFPLLSTIFEDLLERLTNSPRRDGESDDLRHLLNVINVVVNPTRDNTRIKNSINYFLNKIFFKRIDKMEISEDEKNRRKDALKFAVNNVVDAIIGEKPNSDNLTTLLRSVVTVLASLNSAVSNRSLLLFVGHFLAENPTEQELRTKSRCLLAIFYRQVLEYVMNVIKVGRKRQEFQNEVGPLDCTVTLMQDVFRLFLEQVPKKVSNICDCEDFAMVGY